MQQQREKQLELNHEEVLWLLGSLCGFFRLPFEASLVAQECPPPHTLTSLHEAARSLGLKTGHRLLPRLEGHQLVLPAIAFEHPVQVVDDPPPTENARVEGGDRESGPEPPALSTLSHLTPLIIVKVSTDTLLYFRPGRRAPETMPLSEVSTRLVHDFIFVTKESSAGPEEDIAGFTREKTKFGFAWFIPELLKHKAIWRDVLLASLAIQLVGLVTPVFTQIIIDKVIVHQTSSTLIVLGVALVMFMLFTSGMTWLRQYLVLHTGNRIDAVLGSQVLRHLLRLPLPYFEFRSTGVLVARMQGVETIREFVSGAAVTLVLDFPFLLIFLAVMFAYL